MLDGEPGQLDGAGDVCHVSGLVWRHGHRQPIADVPDALRRGRYSPPAPQRRSTAATTGFARAGFDERFFCYVEDVDLGFRLQLAGRPAGTSPDAVVHHVGSASAGVGSQFAVYHGHRNLEWMFVKNMPAPLFWRYLPLHLATWVAGLAWFARRGRGRTFLRAKWDALRGMGPALRARRTSPPPGTATVAQLRGLLNHDPLRARFGTRISA